MTTHDLPIKDLKLLTDVVTEEELKEYQAKLSAEINLVTDAKIKEALDQLIEDAPEAFDTLKEIAEWIINHGKKAKDLVDRVHELSSTVSALSVDLETNYDTIESVNDKVSQLESRLVGEATDLSSDITIHGVKNYAEARASSVYQMLTERVNALKGNDTDLSTVKTINGLYNRLTTIYNFLNDKIETEEEKIRKIIQDAPEALDTLKEIADWIENHAQEFEDIKNHVNNTTIHVTAENKATWNAKQDALDRTQMAAVNSGVTADWKTDVDSDLVDYDNRLSTLETNSATKTELQTTEQNVKQYAETKADEALTSAKAFTNQKINSLSSVYDTKGSAAQALADAKTYVDEGVAKTVENILSAAPEAFDTLKEIADWIENDQQGTAALISRVEKVETNKADLSSVYTKTQADETFLKEHQDISGKADLSSLNSHANNTTVHITATERSTWNAKQNALTEEQLAATNSGVTEAWKSGVDGHLSGHDSALQGISQALQDRYTKAEIDELSNVYETKGSAAQALADAKDYTDSEIDSLTTEINNVISNEINPRLDTIQTGVENIQTTLTQKVDSTYLQNNYLTTTQSDQRYLQTHQDISGKADLSAVYSKEEADSTFLKEHQDISGKADISSVYSKSEADQKFLQEHQDISRKADLSSVYTKVQADETFLKEHQDISGKADISAVYTKEEADQKFLQEHQDITGKADISSVYSKTEADEKFQPVGDYALKSDVAADKISYTLQHNLVPTPEPVTTTLSAELGIIEERLNNSVKLTEYNETRQQDLANIGQAIRDVADSIPTKVSQLNNDAGYLTEHQDISGKADLSSVYTKAQADETFLKEHQDISGKADRTELSSLAFNIALEYATKTDVQNAEENANQFAISLSSNYDAAGTAEIKANAALNEAKAYTDQRVSSLSTIYDTKGSAAQALADAKAYTDLSVSQAVANVIDSAPEAYDTLKEIADWIEHDQQGTAALIARVTNVETNKADLSTVTNLQTYTENAFTQVAEEMNSKASNDALTATNERLSTAETTLTQVGSNVAQLGTTVSNHISNTDIHTSAAEKAIWNAKQNALSETQLSAVNSGVNADWKTAVDNHFSGLDSAIQGITTGLNNKADKADVDEIINNLSTVVNPKLEQILDLVEEEVEKVDQKADLSSVYTKTEADSTFATKTELENGITDAIDTANQHTNSIAEEINNTINNLSDSYDAKGAAAQALIDAKAYTDLSVTQAVANVIDAAPEAYDTLKEIADWIENDQQGTAALIARVTANESNISSLSSYTVNGLSSINQSLEGLEDLVEEELQRTDKIYELSGLMEDKADLSAVYTKTVLDRLFLKKAEALSTYVKVDVISNYVPLSTYQTLETRVQALETQLDGVLLALQQINGTNN